MFTRKPRLRPAEFLITSAKRLLQHNRHLAAKLTQPLNGRYWTNNGRRSALAMDCSAANYP